MGVYRHKNSVNWQVAFQIEGRKFSFSSGTSVRRDAENMEPALRERAIQEIRFERAAGPCVTFNQAAGKYWKTNVFDPRPQEMKTENAIQREISRYDDLVEAGRLVGLDTLCADVDTLRMTEIRDLLRKQPAETPNGLLKNSSINRRLTTIATVLNFSKDFMSTALPNRPRMKEVLLPEDDRDRIIDYDDEIAICDQLDDHFHAPFALTLETGLRRGDVIGLKWADVRLEERYLLAHIKSKSRKFYKVPLNERAIEILRSVKGQDLVHVFTWVVESIDVVNGAPTTVARRMPFKKSHFSRSMKAAFRAAKIGDLTFHDLRRTAGTRYYLATKDYEATRQFLGHSSVKVTKRYIRMPLANVAHGVVNMDRARAGRGWMLKPAPPRPKPKASNAIARAA